MESADATTVYRKELEPSILRETEAYYKAEGERLVTSCNAAEYLRRVSRSSPRLSLLSKAHAIFRPKTASNLNTSDRRITSG